MMDPEQVHFIPQFTNTIMVEITEEHQTPFENTGNLIDVIAGSPFSHDHSYALPWGQPKKPPEQNYYGESEGGSTELSDHGLIYTGLQTSFKPDIETEVVTDGVINVEMVKQPEVYSGVEANTRMSMSSGHDAVLSNQCSSHMLVMNDVHSAREMVLMEHYEYYKCVPCDSRYKTFTSLQLHVQTYHGSIDDPRLDIFYQTLDLFKNNALNALETLKAYFKTRVPAIRVGKDYDYICLGCLTYRSRTLKFIKEHIQKFCIPGMWESMMHLENIDSQLRASSVMHSLAADIIKQIESSREKYVCSSCGVSFDKMPEFQQHILNQSNISCRACITCNTFKERIFSDVNKARFTQGKTVIALLTHIEEKHRCCSFYGCHPLITRALYLLKQEYGLNTSFDYSSEGGIKEESTEEKVLHGNEIALEVHVKRAPPPAEHQPPQPKIEAPSVKKKMVARKRTMPRYMAEEKPAPRWLVARKRTAPTATLNCKKIKVYDPDVAVYNAVPPGHDLDLTSTFTVPPEVGGEKGFLCQWCNAKMFTLLEFAFHLKAYHCQRHTAGFLYSCPRCSATFTNTASLDKHIDLAGHKLEMAIKACTICDMEFQYNYLLWRHELDRHGKTRAGINYCEICPAVFTSKTSYDNHKNGHHMVFSCPLCYYVAIGPSPLEMLYHVESHTTRTITKCPDCHSVFFNEDDDLYHRSECYARLPKVR